MTSGDSDISSQLTPGSISAYHYLPEPKKSEQKGNEHKPSREGREVSSIFGYQTFIFAILCFGFIFMIAGLNILEGGRIIFGAAIAGFGFFLCVYSGLLAISWGADGRF